MSSEVGTIDTMEIFKNNIKKYIIWGLTPFPAAKDAKKPIVEWKDVNPSAVAYERWSGEYATSNIWVRLEDYVVIDPDGPEAEAFVKSLNLPVGPISASSNRSIHRWFRNPSPIKPLKVPIGPNGSYLEVRTGQQGMLVPPSIHPETGKAYHWVEGYSPDDIPFPELPLEIYEKIKALDKRGNGNGFESSKLAPSLSLDVKGYLDHYNVKYHIKQIDEGTLYALDSCLFADQHTTLSKPGDSGIIQGVDGKLTYQCFHNHCREKKWDDARKAISKDDEITRFLKDQGKPIPAWEKAVMSLDDLRMNDFPEKRRILSPWLSEQSIVLVAGWRGVGKTWFALAVIDAITRGISFGPWNTETSVPCWYIDGEMAIQDVQERFRILGISRGNSKEKLLVYSDFRANSLGLPKANLLNPAWREWVRNKALDWGIKVIVLDNLSSLCPGIDENSKKEWDPINQWLLELRFNGVSTIMLHHTNKVGGQRGTSGREDNVDISILLTLPTDYSPEDGARFIVKFSKSRIRHQDLSLITDMELHLKDINGELRWVSNSIKGKNKLEVLRLLSNGIAQRDIPEILHLSKGQVSKIKTNLIEDDFWTKRGTLTKKGEDELDGLLIGG